jgi:TfoX/Sxy family transcriptional regulator of competence genes
MSDSEKVYLLTNFLTQDELYRFQREIKDDIKYSYGFKEQFNQYDIKLHISKNDAIQYYNLFTELFFLVETKVGQGVSWKRFKDVFKNESSSKV